MTILYAATIYNGQDWVTELSKWLPDEKVEMWPDVSDPAAIEYVVCWDFDVKEMAAFTNLKGVLVAGAGVNHLRPMEAIPDVPIVRLVDPAVASDIANYVIHWVIHFHRHMPVYAAQQVERSWRRHPYRATADTTIGVMGVGTIGKVIAERVIANGYKAAGWNRSPKQLGDVEMYAGIGQLHDFLARCEIIVNVLPLTTETKGILNADAFDAMPAGSFMINVGRGGTIDEDALCAALASGQLGGAALDVAKGEPLGADSPLWGHPGVVITPHVSGFTYPETAVALIAANIKRIRDGEEPFPLVDRAAGY